MPCRLTREEVVSIQVLSEKGVPKRQIAREMQVAESTVRYHVRRGEDGALDGRSGKGKKADEVAGPIEAWVVERRRDARPANLKELHEHLVAEHGYGGSYKSVVRWVRSRWGRPKLRTYRRVETPPGAQAQTDWGHFKPLLIGSEEVAPPPRCRAGRKSRLKSREKQGRPAGMRLSVLLAPPAPSARSPPAQLPRVQWTPPGA